ncbi:penicillin-binding protein 2, partial [Candidatus Saganbacteria bacterium]|nr:penicillin-binding protein 2 [Candidatus Saganbacteria bacterium]
MELKRRISFLLLIFIVFFGIIILRLFDLQVIHHRFYQEKSLGQRTRIINRAANRGDILDCRGEILATSIDTYSVFTHLPAGQAGKNGFSWLVRKADFPEAERLRAQNPSEIFFLKEKKRVYPKGNLASQVIGFVGLDNQGLSGVELSWDKYLKGETGRVITEGDPTGRELYGALREVEPGSDGMNLTLTIDGNVQYVAEREIAEQIKKSRAASGMLIVMRAKTGEILALASKQDFDPNDYAKSLPRLWHPRFLDPYEPGSTFKVITTAAGLEEKVITLDTKLRALDQIEVGGRIIENSHPVRWPGPEISISKMLEESINTGVVQIGLKLGPEKFYRRIRKFGFGEETDFGMEGESPGIVRHWENWYKPDIGMMTFGQSIAVTPLQLLSAVSAFANDGKIIKPYLVKKIESADGKFVKTFARQERGQAVSERTASDMKELLRNVVLKGSGRRARM